MLTSVYDARQQEQQQREKSTRYTTAVLKRRSEILHQPPFG